MRAFLNGRLGLQSSIDFITSYGVVLLVVSVTIYLILQLGVFNPQLAPIYCNPAASFSCTGYVLYTNGTFTFELTQTIGGAINITGMGCSTEINGTGTGPRYGNVNLVGAVQYYPTNGFTRNTILLSNTAKQFSVYCYNKPGATPATGTLGGALTGYVWLNYTYSGLPPNYPTAQQVLAFSTTYT